MAKLRNLMVLPGDQLDPDVLALDGFDTDLDAGAALEPVRLPITVDGDHRPGGECAR